MAWWKRFFKKKTEPVEEDDWEQLVYTRNGVNFEEEDQRKRYIVNCLEQIAEASREIDLLTGEYTLVTSYLTDMEEIEALPAQQRGEINRTAGKISALEQERSKYREKKNRMKDADYYAIRKREDEIEEGFRRSGKAKNTAIWYDRICIDWMENGMPMNIAEMNWRI